MGLLLFSTAKPSLVACSREKEVGEWAAKLNALGYTHGPIEDVQYAVTAHIPDGIAIEFFFPK